MKSKVDKVVNMHVEITEIELIEAISEYVKQRTPRLTGRKKGGLLQMDKIRIKLHAFNGDVLDLTGIAGVSGDIEHADFFCEVK